MKRKDEKIGLSSFAIQLPSSKLDFVKLIRYFRKLFRSYWSNFNHISTSPPSLTVSGKVQ